MIAIHNYWNKEKCKIEALKYNTRTQFQKNSNAYQFAWKNNWLDEICSHMRKQGSLHKRLIYVYEFSDKSVYIGLTCNIEQRQKDRDLKENDPVTKYQKETGLIPERKILTDYLEKNVASEKEGEYLEKYKSEGWKILNIAKTGALGGGTKFWTKEKCLESAKKYKTRYEWYKNEKGAYKAANNFGITFFNECCEHMDYVLNYWTKEACLESAKKYKTRNEWYENNGSSYNASKKYGNEFFEQCCSHMINGKIFLTKEVCFEISKKYKTRSEWNKNSKSSYEKAKYKYGNEFFEQCCSHI